MTHIDLSVVLVNYNSGSHLSACLDDLAAERRSLGLEVLALDNCSTDESWVIAQANHPWVAFRANGCNLGFARACNLGLGVAQGRHLMLLNPDTRLQAGALTELVRYLDDHPQVGAVGPRLLNPDGSIQLSARSAQGPMALLFHRSSLLTRLWPTNPGSRRYLLSDWDHAACREVDWLSGAALMVRREAVERAGLMDENFFLFHEDVDWCRRIQAAGFKVIYRPQAEAVHAVGISKDKESLRLLAIRHRSMIHYVHKHHRRLGPLLWLADLAIGLRFGFVAALTILRKRR